MGLKSNMAVGASWVTSTLGKGWGSKAAVYSRNLARGVVKGSNLRGGYAYAQYGIGAAAGGALGYMNSGRDDGFSETMKGAGLGVLGVAGTKMGMSIWGNSQIRAGLGAMRSRAASGWNDLISEGDTLRAAAAKVAK